MYDTLSASVAPFVGVDDLSLPLCDFARGGGGAVWQCVCVYLSVHL